VGRVGRRKLARLDLSHPYQHAFLERGLMRRRLIDEELDPVLDQAMMYSSGITTMVLGEMADVAETLEGRVFHNMDMQDVRMDECQEPTLLTILKFYFQSNSPTFPHSSLLSHNQSSSKQDKTIHMATQVHGDKSVAVVLVSTSTPSPSDTRPALRSPPTLRQASSPLPG